MKTAQELAREHTEKALKANSVVCNDAKLLEQAITAASVFLQKALTFVQKTTPLRRDDAKTESDAAAMLFGAIKQLNFSPKYDEFVARLLKTSLNSSKQ